jgi:excisionase family DNA binding protein
MAHITPPEANASAHIEPLFLTVRQAATKLGISTYTVYKMLDAGTLDGVYQGARRYVVAASIPAYIASLSSTPPAESA